MSAVAAPRRRLDVSPRHALRYWHRNVRVFRRVWLAGLVAWFLEPVIYLVAMGFGLGQYLEQVQGIRYVQFIAPGLLAVSAMYGATFEVTWNAHYKMERQRVYDAVAATPVSYEDVALGEVLWGTTRAAIYGSAFAVIVTAFGLYRSWWGLLTIPSIALVGFVFSVFGLTYAYFIRRIDFLAYYWTMFLTPMFMFSGIFFPLDRLPSWIQTLAWFMPLHHGTELMRALMSDGDPVGASGHALWLLVVGLGTLWIPLVMLRRRLAR